MQIRPLEDVDLAAVLALNEESVAALSPMSADDLRRYRTMTPHVLVYELDESVAAFAVAYPPGTDYASINYRWHADRFADFLYLDRIAVGSRFRRRGIANALYDQLEEVAKEHGRMVCEVYSDPPNHESLAFHRRRGYLDIGHLAQPNGHQVVMLEKRLAEP